LRTNRRPGPWTGERAPPASRGKSFASTAANKAAATLHEVYGGNALTDEYPCKKLQAYVDMRTVGESTENVQRILIAEDTLGLKDANRHRVRNRAQGGEYGGVF
jgi:isovaleryl-CoA dehydrogenase